MQFEIPHPLQCEWGWVPNPCGDVRHGCHGYTDIRRHTASLVDMILLLL